jgi:hypothetical protein
MQVRKFRPFTCDVIVVDGMWGVGKTAVTSVIGSMPRVEKMRINPVHEYACVLHHLGRMSADAADFMISTFADHDQYHNLIGREVNFRPGDASGTPNTPGSTLRYLRRMLGDDGDRVVDEINSRNVAHHAVTHQVLPVAGPIFDAFGDRLKMLHVVRHPVHLVRYWRDYLSDLDREREFTVSIDHEGTKVPWWAAEWADRWAEMTTIDRTVASLVEMYRSIFSAVDARVGDPRLLVLSFEDVVMRPTPSFAAISAFLGRPLGRRTDGILVRERIPRPTITHGRAFSAHNWASSGEATEADIYAAELSLVTDAASPALVGEFLALVDEYDRRHPCELAELRP